MEVNMKRTTIVLITSLITNLFLSISKIIVGIWGRSQALVADGAHSFSDLATDLVALFGNKMATRPADMEHPFGHGRVEYITSMFIAVTIIGLGFTLIKDSFLSPHSQPDQKVLWLVVLTIILKLLVSLMLIHIGKKDKNQILVSSGKESLMDVLSSCVVFVAIFLSQFQDRYSIFAYADRIGGVFVGILILIMGITLLKENISILIGQRELDPVMVEKIVRAIATLPLSSEVHDVVLIKYGPYYRANIAIRMDDEKTLHEYHHDSNLIKTHLMEQFATIQYIDIQVNQKK